MQRSCILNPKRIETFFLNRGYKMRKTIITIMLATIALTGGCSFGISAVGGVGQTGNQSANNMATGNGAGDHSSGTGSGFSEDDSLSGMFRSLRRNED
jgi:hypothetical protein